MRDLASCFSEYAVQVSDTTSCSSYRNASCISPSLTSSVLNAVTCLYRATLSSREQILITLTWTKNALSQGLSVSFGDGTDPSVDPPPPSPSSLKVNTNSRLFRKLKGSKSIEFQKLSVEVSWDLSAARYESGPEPVDGFYVLVTVDSEPALVLGRDPAGQKKLRPGKCSLISRQENFSGNALYSTWAPLGDAGGCHEIVIRCAGEDEGLKHPMLMVCIDKKTVIRVKRLRWNFRGNHTIFLDGSLIDLMWDVHDWFYDGASGSGNSNSSAAVFMFKRRSGFDSRLWLEEKIVRRDQEKTDFSLLICASKTAV